MLICICLCICIYVYVYIYVCINIYICIYTRLPSVSQFMESICESSMSVLYHIEEAS